MRVEITQKGALGSEGEHKVGDIVTVKGDKIPGYLINKCRPIGRVAVTNPADDAAPGGDKSPERLALEARSAELGITVHPQAKDETLAKKIAEAEAEAAKGGE